LFAYIYKKIGGSNQALFYGTSIRNRKMIKQKLTLITSIILTLTFSIYGQSDLARINDEDGFTLLRNGQSIDSAIIDTIYENDFFYCVQSNSDWFEITALKLDRPGYLLLKGFMHKSRIQIIDDLNKEELKDLIERVFEKYENLGIELNNFVLRDTYDYESKTWNSKKDSLDFKDIYQRNNDYSEKYFSPILKTFSNYFCKSQDIETFNLFINTLLAHKGSANEMLSFTLGECFICEPELIQKQLKSIKNPNELELMIDHIDWGLQNLFWTEEDGYNEPSSQEYLNFKKRLELLRE